ncbi:PREDICTED: uncharacterized protein LOC103330778 [Prunus mume]|uniref:Uncharacterized protein LOC103330778 n=1 Tax=Prunus mume TaxID=102107 RepID=A0ABM0NYA0_PRUMU|nr:PREDICTED: uncharacterized protein LOC103330778 [Prunus mume]
MANNGYDSSSSDETGANIIFLEMFENYQRKKAAKKEKTSMVVHGGTSSQRRTIPRDRVSAHENLFENYFSNHPLYPLSDFRNRFRMRRELFNRIMEQIVPFDDYFKQKPDTTGKLGFSPQVKITAAMRMLAYSTTANLNDDYLKIVETTSFEACKRFYHAVNNLYGAEYLHKSTDVLRVRYYLNGKQYKQDYYLADGIYPKWNTIVQSFSDPQGRQHQLFSMMQEAYRKDVERAFGILQARFAVVAMSAYQWYREDIWEVLKTCIILHNMIIEDEGDQDDITPAEDTPYHVEEALVPHEHGSHNIQLESINRSIINYPTIHYNLRFDIIQHLLEQYGT